MARITHLDGGGESTGQISVRMFVQLQKSLLIFHRKQLGWFSWVGAKIIYIIAMAIGSILFTMLSFVTKDGESSIRAKQSFAALKFHLHSFSSEIKKDVAATTPIVNSADEQID